MEAVSEPDCDAEKKSSTDDEQKEGVKEEYLYQSVNKVIKWFEQNEKATNSVKEFTDIISHESGSNDSVSGIQTPSLSLESEEIFAESEERKKPLLKQITLKCEKFYEVYIINFEYMDSFFVTVKRESERRWNRLMRRLDKIKTRNKLEPMEIISRGTFCLVDKDDQLHRAMIQNNNERYAICLGLDNGKLFIVDTTKEPIYKMTYKIRNTIEYQAINCKLYDIRMPKSRELNDFVRAEIIDNFKNFRIKVVKRKYSRFVDNRCMAMNKYEVVLIEDETELNINEEIARNIQGRTEFGWDEY